MKKFPSKITALICMITLEATALHDRMFIAAMLNPSLKRVLRAVLWKNLTGLVGF